MAIFACCVCVRVCVCFSPPYSVNYPFDFSVYLSHGNGSLVIKDLKRHYQIDRISGISGAKQMTLLHLRGTMTPRGTPSLSTAS